MRRLAALLLLLPGFAFAELRYTVSPEIVAHSIRVKLELEAKGSSTEFRIPAWCPGYYVLQQYQKKISDVKVTDTTGKELTSTHTDERAWKVPTHAGDKLVLSYRVLGDDPGLGFFAVSAKDQTVYINGAGAFMFLPDRETEPVRLGFELPSGWDVATPLVKSSDAEWSASGYDELVDSPIQLGKFERRSFTVEGVPFEAVFVSDMGTFRPNMDEEARQLSQISRPAIRMMGGAPFKKYIYFIHLAIGDFSGGLEHRASTVLAVSHSAKLHLDELAAHEFFHAWNVKQIRPKALGPFDYSQKVRVRGLWFAEGVTDYYGHLHTYQSGIWTAKELLQGLANQIAELQESKTRKSKTVEDASMEAWEGGSMGTGDLSYYTKGCVAGLVLDAAIRSASEGQKSLDDVMRLLFSRFHLPNPGFDDDDILRTINEVSGADLSSIYRTVIQSTDEVPYDGLAKLGLRVRVAGDGSLGLGYRLSAGTVVELDDDLAQQGLERGDRILKVDAFEFGPGCFAHVASRPAYSVEVSREGKTLTVSLKTRVMKTVDPILEEDPFADARAEKLRAGWLKKPS